MQSELQKAHDLFHALKLREAYAIYRRYFDKLPFKPEPAHAKVIGQFIRTLFELNRVNELKFYTAELERWYEKEMDFHIAFQLAYIYAVIEPPRLSRALELLEKIKLSPEEKVFLTKTSILKAYCYERKGEPALAAKTIEATKESGDFFTDNILAVWRAKVLRDSGQFEEAEKQLRKLLTDVAFHTDWYAFGSANVILAGGLVKQGNIEEAMRILTKLRTLFEGRPHRSLERQMESVEIDIRELHQGNLVEYSKSGMNVSSIKIGHESLDLDVKIPTDRLLAALVEKQILDKEAIIRLLYGREYRPGDDDSLVYYHIHTLRKQLSRFGLSSEAVTSSDRGYRLTTETRMQ